MHRKNESKKTRTWVFSRQKTTRVLVYSALVTVENLRRSTSLQSLTTFRKHLKTFYFQSAFPGAPKRPTTQRLRFNFWHRRFINSFTYLLTYLLTSRTLLVTLEWIEFECVHKLYPEESDYVRRPKLVTETGLIVRQYSLNVRLCTWLCSYNSACKHFYSQVETLRSQWIASKQKSRSTELFGQSVRSAITATAELVVNNLNRTGSASTEWQELVLSVVSVAAAGAACHWHLLLIIADVITFVATQCSLYAEWSKKRYPSFILR